MNMKVILSLSLAGLISACVSAGKHRELQAQHDATAKELSDLRPKCSAADEKVKEQQIMISELERKLGLTSSAKSKLEVSVQEMKTAMEEMARRKVETDRRLGEFRELVKKFKTLTDAGKLSVKIADGKMVLALSSDVLFASGSAKISGPGKLAIAEVTRLLMTVGDRNFQIEGHTDNVPIRTAQFPSNWELAMARSMTVLNTMLEYGLPSHRISIASFGDTKPVQNNDTDQGKQANRRIEIVVVPDLSSLPGFEELNKAATN